MDKKKEKQTEVINTDVTGCLKNIFDNIENNKQAAANTITSASISKPRATVMTNEKIPILRQFVDWINKMVDEHSGKWTPSRTFINEQLKKMDENWIVPRGHVVHKDTDGKVSRAEQALARPNVYAISELKATIQQIDKSLTCGNCTAQDWTRFSRVE